MYHRLALERYLGQEKPQINPRLLIKKKSDPKYVRKNAVEPVYLSQNIGTAWKGLQNSMIPMSGLFFYRPFRIYRDTDRIIRD